MSDTGSQLTDAEIEDRITKVGTYSRYVKAGFAVIVGAFLLALVGRLPYNLDSVPSAVNAILMPLIFVGMGLLLLGIGMHLHIMHLNLVEQFRRRQSNGGEGSGGNGDG